MNLNQHFRGTTFVVCLLWCVVNLPAPAVIVAGAFGTGNNNSTQAGLDDYLETTSYAPFPYWNNLVRVGTASGVYLGYNASTMRGWVLSANHVSAPSSINVLGNAYTVTGSSTQIGSSDLKLYEIGGISDPALPTIATVPLASIAATAGEFLLMAGRGFTNDTTAPYAWFTPGPNDAYGMRWGTNTVEFTATVDLDATPTFNIQPYVVVDFDASTDLGATAYDAQGATGDSGGGIFIYRGGQWELSGIAHFVDDGPDFVEFPETGDGVNPSQSGDFTAYSDVFSKSGSIQSLTGTLIPEPSVFALIVAGLIPLFRRRRSDRD